MSSINPGDLGPCPFQVAGPFDVHLFIEARLKGRGGDDGFPGFRGFHERARDGTVTALF